MQFQRIITDNINTSRLREGIYKKIGYGKKPDQDRTIIRMVDEAVCHIKKIRSADAIYRTLPVTGTSKSSVTTAAGPASSRKLAQFTRICTSDPEVLFMIITLGDSFRSIDSMQSTMCSKFIVDAAGSEMIELAAEILMGHLKNSPGFGGRDISRGFSPGYCDWPLDGQRLIFDVLDAARIGVCLDQYNIMLPSKTISAICLVSEKMLLSSPCPLCPEKSCPWRREKQLYNY